MTSTNVMGLVCLGLISVMLAVSIPLHCFPTAAAVTAVDGLAGCGLGTALAMVTRSRRPIAIYFWLLIGIMTALTLGFGWPPGDISDIRLWHKAPEIFENYFDFLRGGVYLLAMPFPFAKLGFHRPDPLPAGNQAEPYE